MKYKRTSKEVVLCMSIDEFFCPLRLQGRGHPRREVGLLHRVLEENGQALRERPRFNIERLETVEDICMLTGDILRRMPGMGIRRAALMNCLLTDEGLYLGCVQKKE